MVAEEEEDVRPGEGKVQSGVGLRSIRSAAPADAIGSPLRNAEYTLDDSNASAPESSAGRDLTWSLRIHP